MSKTENDTSPATKRTIKQRLSMWGRNKTTAWFVIVASFALVVTGGFLLGWRNVLSGVVFAAAATLVGGLLLKYLDWQMKERQRVELKHAEMDEIKKKLEDYKNEIEIYLESIKTRDNLPREQQADFEVPNFPILTYYDFLILRQSSYKQPLSNTEKELFKLFSEVKEDIIKHLDDISWETEIMRELMLQMAHNRGVDTKKVIEIVLKKRNKRR